MNMDLRFSRIPHIFSVAELIKSRCATTHIMAYVCRHANSYSNWCIATLNVLIVSLFVNWIWFNRSAFVLSHWNKRKLTKTDAEKLGRFQSFFPQSQNSQFVIEKIHSHKHIHTLETARITLFAIRAKFK